MKQASVSMTLRARAVGYRSPEKRPGCHNCTHSRAEPATPTKLRCWLGHPTILVQKLGICKFHSGVINANSRNNS